jgi:TatD DNase family protein
MNRPSVTFYDTHAHLDYHDFDADRALLIERAAAAGITKIISIGTNFESSRRAIRLAEQFSGVFAAVGWHPSDCLEAPEDLRPELRQLARHPKVVAIGETGLDYYRLPSTHRNGTAEDDARYQQKQQEIFQQQLEVAAELGLNCVIHQRGECFTDTLRLMQPFAGKVRGVFHCFAGSREEMDRIFGMGSLVSFTGIVTFKNAQSVRDCAAAATEFMLETDCPFLAPVPFRGKRCEPSYVTHIAEVVAAAKGWSLEQLSEHTCMVAKKFFPKLGNA